MRPHWGRTREWKYGRESVSCPHMSDLVHKVGHVRTSDNSYPRSFVSYISLHFANISQLRREYREEILKNRPSLNKTEMFNEVVFLAPRPDSYFLVPLFENELFQLGGFNFQIYKRCDLDLMHAMKKYTGVVQDNANRRGWKKYIAEGTAKVNIFGSRGMKRENGMQIGVHPFDTWKADLGEKYSEVYETDVEPTSSVGP